jgi:hypothetical protein
VTVDFAFIEGVPALKPFKVIDLWQSDYVVYGNPNNPIENFLTPMVIPIDSRATAAKFRMITTGHGQGNTANCAEFCMKKHKIRAQHILLGRVPLAVRLRAEHLQRAGRDVDARPGGVVSGRQGHAVGPRPHRGGDPGPGRDDRL